MAGLTFRPALEADHMALEELLCATPMGSRIRLCFERDPDFFAGARVQAEDPCVWAAFDRGGRAVGVFSAGSRHGVARERDNGVGQRQFVGGELGRVGEARRRIIRRIEAISSHALQKGLRLVGARGWFA